MVLVVKCLICNEELNYTQSDPNQLVQHVKTRHPFVGRKSRSSENSSEERNEKLGNDIRQSLGRNSDSLRSLVDREIQTEIDWRYFLKMDIKEEEREALRNSMTSQHTPRSSSEPKASIKDFKQPPKTFSSPAKLSLEKSSADEKTPLKNMEKVKLDIGGSRKARYSKFSNEADPPKQKNRARFYQTSIEKWRPVGDERIHCPRCKAHKRPVVRTHTDHTTTSSFKSNLLLTCWPLCFAPCLFPEPTHEMLHCPVCNFYLGTFDHKSKEMRMNPEIFES